MNAAKRIGFALRLVDTNLARLSTQERQTLKKDLLAFFFARPGARKRRLIQKDIIPWPDFVQPGLAAHLTINQITELQDDARFILTHIVDAHLWFRSKNKDPITPQDVLAELQKRPSGLRVYATMDEDTKEPVELMIVIWVGGGDLKIPLLRGGKPARDPHIEFAGDDPRTAFRVTLAVALSETGVDAVRRCPVCSNVFLAEYAKRQFCGERCKATEMMRRFRARRREQERKRARTNYEQKVRKKSGMKNTKIGTNQKRITQ